ncbi:hypothetical protein FA15DRAFT_172994 [Coprinopsis marcescibilis]|uniref:Transmembrane protein n=1 Tax=Coprinopsis marcescibilis TaxID=230819 RepID=A0A5C3KHI5_COPMA|nr:hypothetical protein FA15DRAFT_172994 [Coprinopsis marcescibilis]
MPRNIARPESSIFALLFWLLAVSRVSLCAELLLIYDVTSSRFTLTNFDKDANNLIAVTESVPYYNRTRLESLDSIDWPTRQLSFAFKGTSFAFFGSYALAPARFNNAPDTWRVDQAPSQLLTISFLSSRIGEGSQKHGQWFTSPTLPDGDHVVEIMLNGNLTYFLLDFAVVTAGLTEDFDNDTRVIVDDGEVSEIFYWGAWNTVTFGLDADQSRVRNYPFKFTTHRTTTVGSGFKFRFAGTSIRIYAMYDHSRAGEFNLTFTLDDQPSQERRFRTGFDQLPEAQPGLQDSVLELPNWLLMEFTSLDAGEHIITANLTHIDNQELIFDYLVYAPSYPNLASKPVFSSGDINPTVSADAASPNLAAILGGSIGGSCFVLGALVIIFLVWRRTRRKALKALGIEPFQPSYPPTYQTPVQTKPIAPHTDSTVDAGVVSDSLNNFQSLIGAPKSDSQLLAGGVAPPNPSHRVRDSVDTFSQPPPAYSTLVQARSGAG